MKDRGEEWKKLNAAKKKLGEMRRAITRASKRRATVKKAGRMEYNLQGIHLEEDAAGEFSWAIYQDLDSGPIREVDALTGRAWIEADILFRGRWNAHDISPFNSVKESRDYLETLPKWIKTKYFSISPDPLASPLRSCETGEPVEITPEIKTQLEKARFRQMSVDGGQQ